MNLYGICNPSYVGSTSVLCTLMLQLEVAVTIAINIFFTIAFTSSAHLPLFMILGSDLGCLDFAVYLGLRWIVHVAKDFANDIEHTRGGGHKKEKEPGDGPGIEGVIGNHYKRRHG